MARVLMRRYIYERRKRYVKSVGSPLERVEGARNVLGAPDVVARNFEAERARRPPILLRHVSCIVSVGQDRKPPQTGYGRAEEFKPLAGKISSRLQR
jgi:hypothetical protein